MRWLLERDRRSEAMLVIESICEVNGKGKLEGKRREKVEKAFDKIQADADEGNQMVINGQ